MDIGKKSRVKIVIVGGGFAGASTAWWLRHYGETDVLILEREPAPGLQASGQNAAMARQATADTFLSRLLAEGVRFLSAPPKDFIAARPLLQREGSAMFGAAGPIQKLADVLARVLPAGEFEVGSIERLTAIAYLANLKSAAVLYTKTDGFIDLQALLDGFLQGSAVRTSCELKSAVHTPEGWALSTTAGSIECSTLVIAAGAWAGPCAIGIGAAAPPVQPTRRHLFESVKQPEFTREAPFVWDITTECYVRPAGGGHLWLSACDQDPYDPSTPVRPSLQMMDVLKEKISRSFPGLARLRFHRYWAGTRALTPDGRFIVGPDPRVDHLHWVAGLGGHGVTTSAAVGRIAAESILGLKPPPAELAPSRFVS